MGPEVKIVHAGPWAGEFGWELCSWNPIIRKMSRQYDRIVVEGPTSSKYLYEFADEYIPNEIKPNTSDGYNGQSEQELFPEADATVVSPNWGKLGRPEMKALNSTFKGDARKEWRCLAPDKPEFVADVLCAFRPVKKYRGRILTDKEYPLRSCTELVRGLITRGLSVACIGGRDNYFIEGTLDLRGKPLEKQCSALAAGRVCVGPSSGTMHLASLCCTPHVVWYNRPNRVSSENRYRDHWNPFKTPHTYMRSQLPSPDEVLKAVAPYVERN